MLHYHKYSHPTSDTWLTFIHGAGGSSSIWYKQLQFFRKHYNILLIDLRGHGKSKKSFYKKLKSYDFKIVRHDVIEVLDYLEIQQTHMVGISLGTIIIRDIAEHHGERVKSMVMGGAVMQLNLRGQFLMRLGNLLKSLIPYMILYKIFAWVIIPQKNHKTSRNIFVNEARKLDQKEFKKWFALVAEINPLLALFRIKDIGIPSLYLMGEEDYMFLPAIEKLTAHQKHATLEIIPNSGHVVNIDQATIFNQSVLRFIA